MNFLSKPFRRRDLADRDYVYLWADGVHFNVRLEEDRLCCLVLVGVRPDGTKELVAVRDGYREDTESWLDLLRDLKERGMTAPELATGDGALGFWAALREVFPTTREQRCWLHRTANVLSALPDRKRDEAKRGLQAIYTAETRGAALDAARGFAEQFAAWPKATAKITDDLERLLTFFDFPTEHHVHLRTTNPIESTFATVRLRTVKTKGNGSRLACLTMVFKLMESASKKWRCLNGSELIRNVIADWASNENGVGVALVLPEGADISGTQLRKYEDVVKGAGGGGLSFIKVQPQDREKQQVIFPEG